MQIYNFITVTIFILLALCVPHAGNTLTLSDYDEMLPESQNSFQDDSANLLLRPMAGADTYQETGEPEAPDFMSHRPGVTPLQEDTAPRNPEYLERMARAKAEAARAAGAAPPAMAKPPPAAPAYSGPPLTLESLPDDISGASPVSPYPQASSAYSSPERPSYDNGPDDAALQHLALPSGSERLLAYPVAEHTSQGPSPNPPLAPDPRPILLQEEAPGFSTRPDAPVIPSPNHPSNQSRLYRNSVEAASPLRSPSETILNGGLYATEDNSYKNSPAWELLALINTHRLAGARCGTLYHDPVPGLESTPLLAQITTKQAVDMDTRGYLSATTPEGKSVGARLTEAGHPWGTVMEIFKRGPIVAQGALDNWMSDPQSCARIMDHRYTHAGFGYSSRSHIWVLTLVGPKPAAR